MGKAVIFHKAVRAEALQLHLEVQAALEEEGGSSAWNISFSHHDTRVQMALHVPVLNPVV